MSKKQDEMDKMFDEIGFAIIQCMRSAVEKNQRSIEKVAAYMKVPSNSLVIDILIPQAVAVMFMAGLIEDISPSDFASYADSFTNMIKNNIFKIRKAHIRDLNQEG